MTFKELINTKELVLVDFHAEWCGPCKMMKPILEKVKSSLGEKTKIVKVDVDKNIPTASEYKVISVPTLILFKKGREVWRQSGVVPPSSLKQVIEKHQ